MYKDLYRTCVTIVLVIESLILLHARWRRRGLLKGQMQRNLDSFSFVEKP